MRFDLADFRLFLCVVEAGSITGGAARANLALASASERLRNMESDAGVQLLVRGARGVTTTEAGEALAHHARLMLRQQATLMSELQGFADGEKGTLQLYANTAALTDFLPGRLARWLAGRPHLNVELKERTSADIVRTIAAGLAEAGIVSDAAEVPGLSFQPIAEDHLVLLLPPEHGFASAGAACFADLLDEPFVGLAPGNALQDHIEDHARSAGRSLSVRIRMKTFDGVCEMVSHGIGVAVMPKGIASRYRRRHAYRTLPLQDRWALRQLCLCHGDWQALCAPMKSLLLHLGAKPNPL